MNDKLVTQIIRDTVELKEDWENASQDLIDQLENGVQVVAA